MLYETPYQKGTKSQMQAGEVASWVKNLLCGPNEFNPWILHEGGRKELALQKLFSEPSMGATAWVSPSYTQRYNDSDDNLKRRCVQLEWG